MSQVIEIIVSVRVKKGDRPSARMLRKTGGPLSFIPSDFVAEGRPEDEEKAQYENIATYRFRRKKPI